MDKEHVKAGDDSVTNRILDNNNTKDNSLLDSMEKKSATCVSKSENIKEKSVANGSASASVSSNNTVAAMEATSDNSINGDHQSLTMNSPGTSAMEAEGAMIGNHHRGLDNSPGITATSSQSVTTSDLNSTSSRGNGEASTVNPGGPRKLKSRLSSKVSSVLSHLDFQHCEPDIAINMMRSPNIKVFSALNRKLKSCDSDWMNDFLEGEGFEVLYLLIDLGVMLLSIQCIGHEYHDK